MLRQGDLVDFSLVLEVFREDYLVDSGSILGLFLETLLYYHVEVLCDALGDSLIFLSLHLVLELLYRLGIIGIFLGAHLIHEDT